MRDRTLRVIENIWYGDSFLSDLLRPCAAGFASLVRFRRWLYRRGILKVTSFPIPVIVVGNLAVGGTGKTPFVMALATALKAQGFHPGIISRGYGARTKQWPCLVTPQSDPIDVGDEPLLMARRTGCPVIISPNRVQAARRLLDDHACDLILSDDGLQHYALDRDLEVLMIDGDRRFGNGYCFPAGPLREPLSRLAEADFIVTKGPSGVSDYAMTLTAGDLYQLSNPATQHPLSTFLNSEEEPVVHAVAGIANPTSFFSLLRTAGLTLIEHPFSDHHPYTANDLAFSDELPIILTEKDAVKCQDFTSEKVWVLPLHVDLSTGLVEQLLSQLPKGKPV